MDFTTYLLLGLALVMIILLFRGNRKRQAAATALQKSVVPGAEVMLQSGIYGTVVSLDEDENRARIETSPGTVLTVHRNAIANVVTPVETEEKTDTEIPADDDPEFGERVNRDDTDNESGK
ncbi:preprotein translocase subunit YajC [Lysinibacter sp. HNR]|uniref:preprotein translocase subunit YajC n=1 Tax=Lysinibacter sp. HNR TaxID=3031408 RepID=UPI002435A9AE|nr:preprotein translocase subunit YajC [Lysinibacter sp. HNR]WGD36306.1 preprotein translocase subunit YajC [Lysinibacter sp. HNR]